MPLQCATSPTVERIIHCSTTGVLGVTGAKPADEAAPFAPTNIYEQTKLEAELLAREAGQQGLPIVIVRPGLVAALRLLWQSTPPFLPGSLRSPTV
jgi:nucleoside-diphosphate-sugar epimerase